MPRWGTSWTCRARVWASNTRSGFKPNYVVIEKKDALIKELKNASKKADTVYLAPDPDREGEFIAWSLKELLGLRKPRRAVFNEITKRAVQDAIANTREIDEDLFNAQQARRVLDRLVGYKISPLLWRRVQSGTSAGRVQSVALRLICRPRVRDSRLRARGILDHHRDVEQITREARPSRRHSLAARVRSAWTPRLTPKVRRTAWLRRAAAKRRRMRRGASVSPPKSRRRPCSASWTGRNIPCWPCASARCGANRSCPTPPAHCSRMPRCGCASSRRRR